MASSSWKFKSLLQAVNDEEIRQESRVAVHVIFSVGRNRKDTQAQAGGIVRANGRGRRSLTRRQILSFDGPPDLDIKQARHIQDRFGLLGTLRST